jgi:hypothetical protein
MKEKSITELKDEKATLATRSKEIIEKAKSEKRMFNNEENEELGGIQARMAEINVEIEEKIEEAKIDEKIDAAKKKVSEVVEDVKDKVTDKKKEKKVKEKPEKKFFSRKKTVSKTKVEKTNTKKGSK